MRNIFAPGLPGVSIVRYFQLRLISPQMTALLSHTAFSRKQQLLQAAGGRLWDVVVIGGGASGLGVAVDAAARGYKTLLLEQADFAKGTSSRSTKLVHGGVRYLAQGNVKLVREACRERGRLLRNAPHLVSNQRFFVPVYNRWDALQYTAGLKLYDWMAGSLSLGASTFVSPAEALVQLPGLNPKGLRGAVQYHDGQFDDARLAISLLQTFLAQGGCALNYARVAALSKNSAGQLTGLSVREEEGGETFRVEAKAVVNATGVFVDAVMQMDNAAARNTVCVSQGIHMVVGPRFFPSPHALMIPKTADGRVLFAVPWHGKVVIGTTDTPVPTASLEPQATGEEIGFVLRTAAQYLLQAPSHNDVLSVFAGLRPLAMPQGAKQKTKEISRSHKIVVSPSGLFTLLGGKWTTYRQMGEEMVGALEKHFGWPQKKSTTATLPLHGHTTALAPNDPFWYYGCDAPALHKAAAARPDGWLSQTLRIHAVQVEWAVKNEMARTVEDVLARRTRALLLDARESLRICGAVARLMAPLLEKGDDWIRAQQLAYMQLANSYLLSPDGSVPAAPTAAVMV